MAAQQWWVFAGDKQHGPLTSKQLQQRAQQGRVPPDTLVKNSREGNWMKAGWIKGLSSQVATQPVDATRAAATDEGEDGAGLRNWIWGLPVLVAVAAIVVVVMIYESAQRRVAEANKQVTHPVEDASDEAQKRRANSLLR